MQIEEIINFKIPLVRDDMLSNRYNANVSYLDGSVFPTGTVKVLRSAQIINPYLKENLDNICNYEISWGNSAYAHGLLLQRLRKNSRNIQHVVMIPKGYEEQFRNDLEKFGSFVVEVNVSEFIDKEKQEDIVRSELERHCIDSSQYQLIVVSCGVVYGYGRLGEEILRQNPNPDFIVVPYGNGEIGLGLYGEFSQKFDAGLIEDMPRFIFVQTNNKTKLRGKNITEDKTRTRFEWNKGIIKELVEKSAIEIVKVSEKERDNEYEFILSHGISVEKTSALAFAGAKKYNFPPDDNVVIVNTGQGRWYKKDCWHKKGYDSFATRIAMAGIIMFATLYHYTSDYLVDRHLTEKVVKEFSTRYEQRHNVIYSPAVGDSLIEEREAFVNGIISSSPAFCSVKRLQGVAYEGKRYRTDFSGRILTKLIKEKTAEIK